MELSMRVEFGEVLDVGARYFLQCADFGEEGGREVRVERAGRSFYIEKVADLGTVAFISQASSTIFHL
jgi:hypothetical protein